jgi:hypothetical protein
MEPLHLIEFFSRRTPKNIGTRPKNRHSENVITKLSPNGLPTTVEAGDYSKHERRGSCSAI